MRACLALAALLPLAAQAAEVPRALRQGMDYARARGIVLQNGWQASMFNPMQKDDLQQTLQEYFIGKGFNEVETCMPTGIGTCVAVFHDAQGRKLYLFTGEPGETSARLTSWCFGRKDPNCGR